MKQKIYNLLHKNKVVIKFIYGLIIFNIIALILESYQELRESYGNIFQLIEVISVLIFTLEYLLRIWVADLGVKRKNNRLKFVFSPLGIIDLVAILPRCLKSPDLRRLSARLPTSASLLNPHKNIKIRNPQINNFHF